MAEEESVITAELSGVGVVVTSVWDLVNSKDKYKEAIPVLKKHMKLDYSDAVLEGIFRALSVRWLNDDEVVEYLFHAFETVSSNKLRWVIGNALSILVKKQKHADRAIEILMQYDFGEARMMLVHCYAKVYKDESVPHLVKLLDDDSILAETIVALGNTKSPDAKIYIEKYINSSDSWIRQKAKAALKKIK